MAIGLVGTKVGMTRIFTEVGDSTPVTIIQVNPNYIIKIKQSRDFGYSALQIGAGRKKLLSRVNKPIAGCFVKAGVEPTELICEFRVQNELYFEGLEVGQCLSLDQFKVGDLVDIAGMTKGKGFQGCVKRHGFNTQDATHGNSLSHRKPGSTGQCQDPGRVFKGKKMAGRMGYVLRTIQNLAVIKVGNEAGLDYLCVKGGIPGARGQHVWIYPAVKRLV